MTCSPFLRAAVTTAACQPPLKATCTACPLIGLKSLGVRGGRGRTRASGGRSRGARVGGAVDASAVAGSVVGASESRSAAPCSAIGCAFWSAAAWPSPSPWLGLGSAAANSMAESVGSDPAASGAATSSAAACGPILSLSAVVELKVPVSSILIFSESVAFSGGASGTSGSAASGATGPSAEQPMEQGEQA